MKNDCMPFKLLIRVITEKIRFKASEENVFFSFERKKFWLFS